MIYVGIDISKQKHFAAAMTIIHVNIAYDKPLIHLYVWDQHKS